MMEEEEMLHRQQREEVKEQQQHQEEEEEEEEDDDDDLNLNLELNLEEEQEEQEEHEQHEQEDVGMQLAIATTFSVAPEAGDFVIKQEPQEPIPEMIALPEAMDHEMHEHEEHEHEEHEHGHEHLFGEDAMDDDNNLPQVFPEDCDIVMRRAVSPPTYADPSEQSIEELVLYYKEKYQLQDVTVELENCDKIWETLQLIKNIQGSSSDQEDDPDQFTSPKNSFISQPKLIPYQPILGNNNKALPDFRFSVKSKKKLYHCITCGKEFIDSHHLRQHAFDEHGVYVNPKRIYKPRLDNIPKVIPLIAEVKTDNVIEEMETETIEESIVPPIPVTQPVEIPLPAVPTVPTVPIESSEVKNIEKPLNTDLKTDEPQIKINNSKDKMRCILCKRVCTDIVYHMKGYHKVGCVNSIIAQCEKVTSDYSNVHSTSSEKVSPDKSNESKPDPIHVDVNETLAVAVKKRKRNMPRWTIQKRKYKPANITVKTSNKGPFKCTVCLGFYKTIKSFSYHRKIHRIRGETPENFDPSKCRFLNSPLRMTKANQAPVEAITNPIAVQKEPTKSQTSITNYITVQTGTINPENQNEESTISEDLNMEVDHGNRSERTCCKCSRSFRTYHTMYLHKVKCKGPVIKTSDKLHLQSPVDTDSSIGISIKIKKNKNDSYEVVPRNTPTEESYKDSRSSKDSDASSNDSGMVSVDYNNQKVDSSEASKYSKGHSILRIQVAEDDEEVDIEDDDSIHSTLNDSLINNNKLHSASETVVSDTVENKVLTHNENRSIRSATRRNNIVPLLTNLCKQVLSKSKQRDEEISAYRCQTCATYFKNKTELMEHALKMKHDAKSHCPCGKSFKNLKYFNIHVRRFHPLLLKCSYCMTNFDRIEKYTEHKCEVIEGNLFIEPIIQTQCLQCKALVDLGEPFDKHMKTHITDTILAHQCFKCELKFESTHQRRLHFNKEHGFALCRICGKLLHIDYLSKHEAYHDGLGHPCHLCKKAYTQKTLLKKHIQGTHDPLVNEIVKCIVCSKSLKLRYLKKHMSIHLHTEICRKCNKCYRSDEQKNLEDHVALDHPNDYPTLKCDICNMSFLSDERYKEHCHDGTCKSDLNNTLTSVQNTTSNR